MFADDQVVEGMDEKDTNYMIRELLEEYKSWGFDIYFGKTDQLVTGGEGACMTVHSRIIKISTFV